ncbi:Uu.00g001240.m01.CDS01 [Anthostomella pinea]|uniref:Uu.00g001240.m01.CDS01 n=1 Tax=Anthostomella pinea TaxID=933095 RepID=A0AAI8VKG7_9PEZI|nr:Uu.00g001240.m01.CDS01 [Anthostomella pinea]
MADQCIVCLENLDVQASPTLPFSNNTNSPTHDGDNKIAVIQVCGHVLHDACLREWTGKANSCPICRQAFHLVHVYDKVGGTEILSYEVEDKKQVAEFDPQAWLDENPEEADDTQDCPICGHVGHEEVLILCDGCDTPYHTYCIGLDSVPRGHWFCMECSEQAAGLLSAVGDDNDTANHLAGFDGRSAYLPRTRASMRRARQRARSDEWQGAWGQIAGRVWDVLNIDLDNHDDDEALRDYRRSQQRRDRERREYQRWQQRINIASRLGAHDVFANNLSNVLPHRVAQPPPPPPPQETPEEKQAWGALEKAMETESSTRPSPNHRKRKSRSVTASPVEPAPQPERKLKRPRTRRVRTQSEASTSNSTSVPSSSTSLPTSSGLSSRTAASPPPQSSEGPSFLSSLLREVETSPSSDDENIRALFAPKPAVDPSSPASSPSPSAHSSPRALSTTPPPRGVNDRPGSPLSLSSRIEPIYPPANYAASRNGGDHSDSETRSRQVHHQHNGASRSPEIRQPRPRRQQPVNIGTNLIRSHEASPTRANLPFEVKESISGIVKNALQPHWKSGQLTAEAYASINRDLSHKLYKEISEAALDDNARNRFEKIASKEVTRAIADLKT